MIRVLCLALCVPSFASADAWATFVDRCLAPMEAVDGIVLSDLTLAQRTDVSDTYRLETDAYVLETTLSNQPGVWGPQSCVVAARSEESSRDLIAGFRAWEESAIASGRYVPSKGDLRAQLSPMLPGLLSTDFREPLINVSLMQAGSDKPTFVAVQETFLES